MDIGFHNGGIHPELGAVLQSTPYSFLNDGLVDSLECRWTDLVEGPVEGIVLGHGTAPEAGEDAQGVSVGDPFPEFAIVPVFDSHEDIRSENLIGIHSISSSVGILDSRLDVMSDHFDDIFLAIEEHRDGFHGIVKPDSLSLEFEFSKTYLLDSDSHVEVS